MAAAAYKLSLGKIFIYYIIADTICHINKKEGRVLNKAVLRTNKTISVYIIVSAGSVEKKTRV